MFSDAVILGILVFCTPFGWIGIVAAGVAISQIIMAIRMKS